MRKVDAVSCVTPGLVLSRRLAFFWLVTFAKARSPEVVIVAVPLLAPTKADWMELLPIR